MYNEPGTAHYERRLRRRVRHAATRRVERDAITRQNAERWKRENVLAKRRVVPASLRRRGARSSRSLFRLLSSFSRGAFSPLDPLLLRVGRFAFRDYILEIVNRMPSGDAPADIPYISGDPFFEREREMRNGRGRGDLKISVRARAPISDKSVSRRKESNERAREK